MAGPAYDTLPRDTLLDLIAELGRFFVDHDLRDHRRYAAELYRATREGRAARPDRLGIAWTPRFAVEWCRYLRIPPYDRDYPVRSRAWWCPCSDTGMAGACSLSHWPGGYLRTCRFGKHTWIVLEDEISEADERAARRAFAEEAARVEADLQRAA